jgi:hypothetical protein
MGEREREGWWEENKGRAETQKKNNQPKTNARHFLPAERVRKLVAVLGVLDGRVLACEGAEEKGRERMRRGRGGGWWW